MVPLRPLLVVLVACPLIADVSLVFSQTSRPKSSTQTKAKGTPAEKPSDESLVYTPESADDIASSREWRDSTGKNSTKAQLQSFEASSKVAGTVVLKKDDGAVVRVPIQKLSKEDQAIVAAFALGNSKTSIAKAVQSFLEADLGDTDARMAENSKAAAEKLYSHCNGRVFRLDFPIQNITEAAKGMYRLQLGAPKLPGMKEFRYTSATDLKLTKQEALKIGPSDILAVTGRVRLAASSGERGTPMANLFNFIENRDAIEKAHLQAPKPWITWTTSTPLPATRQGMAPKVYLKQVTLGLLDLKMKVTAEEAPKANVPAGDP